MLDYTRCFKDDISPKYCEKKQHDDMCKDWNNIYTDYEEKLKRFNVNAKELITSNKQGAAPEQCEACGAMIIVRMPNYTRLCHIIM